MRNVGNVYSCCVLSVKVTAKLTRGHDVVLRGRFIVGSYSSSKKIDKLVSHSACKIL